MNEVAFAELGVEESIILKRIFHKYNVRIWTGFIRHRIGRSGNTLLNT
jgi:hypothetical protein